MSGVLALRFPGFEGEWDKTCLGDGVDLISGQHLGPEDYGRVANGLPYFTGPTDFTNDERYLSKWTKVRDKVAQAGDLLITVKGSGAGSLWPLQLSKVVIWRQLMALRGKGHDLDLLFHILSNRQE